MRQALRLVEFADNGVWPMAGGVFDQTRQFLDIYRMCKREDAVVREDRSISARA